VRAAARHAAPQLRHLLVLLRLMLLLMLLVSTAH
jgi:hypothetical protein